MLRLRINAGTNATPSGSDYWFIGESTDTTEGTHSSAQGASMSIIAVDSAETGAGWGFASFNEGGNLRFVETFNTTRRFSTAKAAFNFKMSLCSASLPHVRKGCVYFRFGPNDAYSEWYCDGALVSVKGVTQNGLELVISYVVQGGKLVQGTQYP